jgi:metal-responsive CopG/Arc/MetJ family transcriptional regulator
MAAKVKVTVSLDEAIVRELRGAGHQKGKTRSRLVEEALRHWRRRQLEEELKDGYQAMAKFDRATARRDLKAGWEAIKS